MGAIGSLAAIAAIHADRTAEATIEARETAAIRQAEIAKMDSMSQTPASFGPTRKRRSLTSLILEAFATWLLMASR